MRAGVGERHGFAFRRAKQHQWPVYDTTRDGRVFQILCPHGHVPGVLYEAHETLLYNVNIAFSPQALKRIAPMRRGERSIAGRSSALIAADSANTYNPGSY